MTSNYYELFTERIPSLNEGENDVEGTQHVDRGEGRRAGLPLRAQQDTREAFRAVAVGLRGERDVTSELEVGLEVASSLLLKGKSGRASENSGYLVMRARGSEFQSRPLRAKCDRIRSWMI